MGIQYEITQDQAMRDQYFRVREECFREELGLPCFDGSEDEWDRRSHILIARDGDKLAAGVRISGRYPFMNGLVPVEEEGLDLKAALPHLPLTRSAYCQSSRLVVNRDYRNAEFFAGYIRAIIDYTQRLGFHFNISVTGKKQARFYKRLYSALGYEFEIFNDVAIPAEHGFDGLPHLLSIAYLDSGAAVSDTEKLVRVA